MLLAASFERQGRVLFKYRGYFPILLFILVIPFMHDGTVEWFTVGVTKVLFVLSLLLAASGILVRAYTIGHTPRGTSGRNTKSQKAHTLNTTGIYSVVRHPLYLGNFLIWAGIGLFTYNPYYFLILILIFWLFYERIMMAEEAFLKESFGEDLSKWASSVPAFLPRFKGFVTPAMPFNLKKVLRKEYSGFFATVIGFVYVAFLRDLFGEGDFEWDPKLAYILLGGAIITLILRTLHKGTRLLKDRDEQGFG